MLLLLMAVNNHILHRPVRPVYRSGQTDLSRVAGNLLLLTWQCSFLALFVMFSNNWMLFTAYTFSSQNILLNNIIVTIKMDNTFSFRKSSIAVLLDLRCFCIAGLVSCDIIDSEQSLFDSVANITKLLSISELFPFSSSSNMSDSQWTRVLDWWALQLSLGLYSWSKVLSNSLKDWTKSGGKIFAALAYEGACEVAEFSLI